MTKLKAQSSNARSELSDQPGLCPLCGAPNSVRLDSLSTSEIVRAWEVVGVRFTHPGRVWEETVERVDHRRCEKCGFEYFIPPIPGDSAFYGDLQRQFPEYYPRSCPAFDRAI